MYKTLDPEVTEKKKGDKRNISPTLWEKDFSDISNILKGLGYQLSVHEVNPNPNIDDNKWVFVHEYDDSYFVIRTSKCSIFVQAFVTERNPYIKTKYTNKGICERKWIRYIIQNKRGHIGPSWVKRSHFPRPKWRQCIVKDMMPKVNKHKNERLLEMVIDS